MSNLLLNECHPGVHVLLLGLEMYSPSAVRLDRHKAAGQRPARLSRPRDVVKASGS